MLKAFLHAHVEIEMFPRKGSVYILQNLKVTLFFHQHTQRTLVYKPNNLLFPDSIEWDCKDRHLNFHFSQNDRQQQKIVTIQLFFN